MCALFSALWMIFFCAPLFTSAYMVDSMPSSSPVILWENTTAVEPLETGNITVSVSVEMFHTLIWNVSKQTVPLLWNVSNQEVPLHWQYSYTGFV